MAITISGSGIVEANLADNAVTLAKMASGTDGEILTYDASGNPTSVSVGTDGQVLTSTGAGSPPAFEAAAAGGKLLQVSSSSLGGTGLETSTSTDADMCTVTLTPTSSSNKFLILASNAQTYATSGGPKGEVRVYSDLTSAYLGNCSTYQNEQNPGYVGGGTISIEHSLSTWTSGSVTIRLKGRTKNNVYIQLAAYGLATLTVMEISS